MLSIFAGSRQLRHRGTLRILCAQPSNRRRVPGYEAAAPLLGLAALDGGVALATGFSAGALFSAVAGAASALSVLAASAGLASGGRVGSGTRRGAAVLRNALAVTVVAHIPAAALEHKGRLRNNSGRRRAAVGTGLLPVRVRRLDPLFKHTLTFGTLIFVNRHDDAEDGLFHRNGTTAGLE